MRKESTITMHNNNVSPIMRNESAVTVNNNDISSVMRNKSSATAYGTSRTEVPNVIGFVNGRKTTPANIADDNLTREELAMYLKYDMDKRDDEIAALNKKQDEIITSVNGLANTVFKIAESLSILTDNISTLHGNYKIASNANYKLLKAVTETIEKSVDVAKVMSVNIGNNTAEIGKMMDVFNTSMGNIKSDNFTTTKRIHTRSANRLSDYYNQTPANILAKIEKYRDKHGFKSNKGAAHSIAYKMSKKGHIDMKTLRRNKAAEVHYSSVCFGYLVNNDPNLKELFNLVVEEC